MTVRMMPLAALSFRATFMVCAILLISVQVAFGAPFASFVMDARTGEVLEASNADTRLHPASLTKMMTLYIAFEAIKKGEISLDTEVTVSAKAANEQPSKLGLKAGQKIKLRYLIRAAAIKSANDCATAIGEAIGGSEAAFAKRMNRTAKALGMTRTTFKNANGLTEAGHLSTARDMAILGRHLIYDHPEFYNLFSRRSADAGVRTVNSTNSRFLDAYDGADGIKTGYTVAAGFNLVGSAQRGNKRIIAAVFGGTSTAARNAKVAELLDLGFKKAPSNVRTKAPPMVANADDEDDMVAVAVAAAASVSRPGLAAKTLRVSGSVIRSPRPNWRPDAPQPEPSPDLVATIQDGVKEALDAVAEEQVAAAPTDSAPVAVLAAPPPRPDRGSDAAMATDLKPGDPVLASDAPGSKLDETEAKPVAVADALLPAPVSPSPVIQAEDPLQFAVADPVPQAIEDASAPGDEDFALAAEADDSSLPLTPVQPMPAEAGTFLAAPSDRADGPAVVLASIEPETFTDHAAKPVIVTRLSTSSGQHWGINVGSYPSQYEAERVLLTTALREISTLGESTRKVNHTKTGFDANFVGMSRDMAELACQRLVARNVHCTTLGG